MYITYDVFWHWIFVTIGITIAVLGLFIYLNYKKIKALQDFAEATKKAIKFLADVTDHNADIYEQDRAAMTDAIDKKQDK